MQKKINRIISLINTYDLSLSLIYELIRSYSNYLETFKNSINNETNDKKIDEKAILFLAKELKEDIKKGIRPKLEIKEDNEELEILNNGRYILSYFECPIGYYENQLNINSNSNSRLTKIVLLIQTTEYNYILSNNGLFKFGQDQNIYNYYTFKESGEIKSKVKVDDNLGLLISETEVWKFNSNSERYTKKLPEDSIGSLEDIIKYIYEPKVISKSLDIKPKVFEPTIYLTNKDNIKSKK